MKTIVGMKRWGPPLSDEEKFVCVVLVILAFVSFYYGLN